MKSQLLPLLTATVLLGGVTVAPVNANESFQLAQSIWKQFSPQNAGFTVLMPGTPSEVTQTVNSELGPVDVRMFMVTRKNEAVYIVAYSDLPDSLPIQTAEDLDKIFADVAEGFSRSVQGKVVSQESINLGTFPGSDIKLQLPQGFIARNRILLVNKRLYQVVVQTNKEKSLTKSIQGYFNSFRLLQ